MKLVHAFENSSWAVWDREIEEDSQSGTLDFLHHEAVREKRESGLRYFLFTPRVWDCLGQIPDMIMYQASPYHHNALEKNAR